MTVIDGDFPREVVGAQNLIFGEYRMPARRNSAEFYDAKDKKPTGKREGTLKLGTLEPAARRGNASRLAFITMGTVLVMGLVVLGLWRRILTDGPRSRQSRGRRKAGSK
jgi:hypothetical protein